jgi:carbazole 1,9a-dioxygenase ferredoxin component
MHFGMFKIATGEASGPPCSIPIRTYSVSVEGDQVFALIDEG